MNVFIILLLVPASIYNIIFYVNNQISSEIVFFFNNFHPVYTIPVVFVQGLSNQNKNTHTNLYSIYILLSTIILF